MSQTSYTVNEVSQPRFADAEVRAVLVEDGPRALRLLLLDGEAPAFAFRYYGEPGADGMTYEEIAAADWVALHVGRADPDRDGWDNDLDGAEGGDVPRGALGSARIVADSSLVTRANPLGLGPVEGALANVRAFFRAISEGVPEYDGLESLL